MVRVVINDQTPLNHEYLTHGPVGALPWSPEVGIPCCASPDETPLIPWEEIPDRIADQERQKSSLYHIWLDSKIGTLNQNPLQYCWAFSSVYALMLEREVMGLPYVHLSPSSVAAPVVNFQNVGYYTESALKQMMEVGVAPVDFVPETTTNRQDFKIGWKEAASCYKVLKWGNVGNNVQRQLTKLLTWKPTVGTYNWWKHAMVSVRALDVNPKLPANNPYRYGRGLIQSYGPDYGDRGYFEMHDQRAIADFAYCVDQANFVG